MIKADFYLKFQNYKELVKSLFKIIDGIQKDIESKGRLEILIPGLSQIGIMYTSLLKLIPNEESNFDLTSLCLISRSILEFTNNIYFFGIDEVQQDELEFRLDLYNYLSNRERLMVGKQMDGFKKLNAIGVTKDLVNKEKEELINSDFFKKLLTQNLIKEDEIIKSKYISRQNLQSKRKIKQHIYNDFYSLYSTFVHSAPLAIDTYKDFLINYNDRIFDQYKYSEAIIDLCSGFVSVMLLEAKIYTNDWTIILDENEIECINKFANDLIN